MPANRYELVIDVDYSFQAQDRIRNARARMTNSKAGERQ